MKLTDDHLACLGALEKLALAGCLTGNLAVRAGGTTRASWATNRMRTLAKRGLVQRHESNAERWFITEAGRQALAARGGDQ
ncbi:hypothetical protein HCU64_06785 [Methylobacterium sp. C25]|uniref:hypothetical protein n=1 Tax=Methylobacterium sp. C25 TaxID=2721622 RepID=UPI001F3BEA34|nr:hypothetical protein [Methylobacterium sp. C25]MCE4223452.1 hypothetical protein [Methylobacterium sp. C25]